VMVHLARRAAAISGAKALCLGGGVAMNCVAVGRIADSGLFDLVTVPPAPGDSGTALGAALAASGRIATPANGVTACYLGPDADASTSTVIAALPTGLTAAQSNRPVKQLADALAAGAIVGVCRGRVEAGPRALGNRSILASPLAPDIVDRLNATVKYREPFRPFAPVVPARHASDWFDLTQPSPICRSPPEPPTAQPGGSPPWSTPTAPPESRP
jgi:carbamoyltransferase